jgi:hypothetical protein
VGEETSETLYGRAPDKNLPNRSTQPVIKHALPPTYPKRDCYSGLFILQTFDKPLPIRHLKLDIDHPESLETGSQCPSWAFCFPTELPMAASAGPPWAKGANPFEW